MRRTLITPLLLALTIALAAPSAHAYVDLAPTLARLVRDAESISVVQVEKFSRDRGAVILKSVRELKGRAPIEPIRHNLNAPNDGVPRDVLEWASEPGRRGVMFVSGNTALVCLGAGWYQVQASADGWWKMGMERPDLPLAYYGTVSRLVDAVRLMLDGKTAIITTIPHGADDEGASFDLALNRTSLPGLVKVQRLRANLRMPQVVLAASANPAYLVGPGPAGVEEIPELIARLSAPDATVRAESADDLRSLGAGAGAAVQPLEKLLDDPSAQPRLSAAAALLQISPSPAHSKALDTLAGGLASDQALVRRAAARAAGSAGAAAAPLADKLASLLADPDEVTRMDALQAIATLGPAAGGAAGAVEKLLDDPATAVDAADTLGRIGPAAGPAMTHLAKLLVAPSVAVQWAAVRAMSQIGGAEARPAVEFMIDRMKQNPSEVDGYNMMIYLGLLGPVAKEALPAIEGVRIKNPALKNFTMWAIEPDARLPWNGRGRFGPMQQADFARYIFESFLHELGDRVKPSAGLVGRQIMEGNAASMPQWGYRILARFPDEVISTFTRALASPDVRQRERAVVALGYMGPAAASAREQVARALKDAPTPREQNLIAWCLREIDRKADGEAVSR